MLLAELLKDEKNWGKKASINGNWGNKDHNTMWYYIVLPADGKISNRGAVTVYGSDNMVISTVSETWQWLSDKWFVEKEREKRLKIFGKETMFSEDFGLSLERRNDCITLTLVDNKGERISCGSILYYHEKEKKFIRSTQPNTEGFLQTEKNSSGVVVIE